VASADLSCGDIIDFIRRKKLQNLESVQLFDIFEDDSLKAKQQKSMAFSLTFRNSERTLKDEEVNAAVEKLRNALANELKVELR
jgi:phenylalanyl-tRNA synthetase beta chain